MARRRILVINGHPDPNPVRFCEALADAYAEGAVGAGHEVRRLAVGELDTPLLTTDSEFMSPPESEPLLRAREAFLWADHIVLIFPLWLGSAPAKLKAFLEQVFRAGFGFEPAGGWMKGKLKGKSLRLVVTMGMPGAIFRLVFGAHGLLGLEKGVFMLTGIGPMRHSILGGVATVSQERRRNWLDRMCDFGRKAI